MEPESFKGQYMDPLGYRPSFSQALLERLLSKHSRQNACLGSVISNSSAVALCACCPGREPVKTGSGQRKPKERKDTSDLRGMKCPYIQQPEQQTLLSTRSEVGCSFCPKACTANAR